MDSKTNRIAGGKEIKKEVAAGDLIEVFVRILLFYFIPALV
jgi:hypothetical protein